MDLDSSYIKETKLHFNSRVEGRVLDQKETREEKYIANLEKLSKSGEK